MNNYIDFSLTSLAKHFLLFFQKHLLQRLYSLDAPDAIPITTTIIIIIIITGSRSSPRVSPANVDAINNASGSRPSTRNEPNRIHAVSSLVMYRFRTGIDFLPSKRLPITGPGPRRDMTTYAA